MMRTTGFILIYGATGYTGRLAATHAVSRGLRPILAGRRADATEQFARSLGLDWRAFPLDDAAAVRAGLRDVSAVLHAAGPFSATAQPMVDACMQTHTHYVDITGEVGVFEALAARSDEAKAAGIVLLPGAGYDVVPTDCLAAHVHRRLPTATRLRIGIRTAGGMSRGTARTALEGLGHGTLVRRDGRVVELRRVPHAHIDFGAGPRPVTGASWGDVATAWHSTRIPDISVFFRLPRTTSYLLRAAATLRPLLRTDRVQRLLNGQIDRRLAPGPDTHRRTHGGTTIVAEAWDAGGAHVASRLVTAEAYTLTAWTAVDIAQRVASGDVAAGFHTPALAFGADYILGFDGCVRTDVAETAA